MNKKTVKGILIGAGITLGVLIAGVGVTYGVLGTPPALDREVGNLEELLPANALTYTVAADIKRISQLYGKSGLKRNAKKLGIEDDFANLQQIKMINESTQGKLWDVLGSRFIYASYGKEGKLLITQPDWNVRTMWRMVLSRGEMFQTRDIPYAVFSDGSAVAFAGDYFWFASNEDLLLDALKIALSSKQAEKDFPGLTEDILAYGVSRKYNPHLTFDELRCCVSDGNSGLSVDVEIEAPGGPIGEFVAGLDVPSNYARIPSDAIFFVNVSGAEPSKAWDAAKVIARKKDSQDLLSEVDMEKPMSMLASDMGDELTVVMQGWNTDLWFAPARWFISAEASSARSLQAWEKLAPWFFPAAYADTSYSYKDASYTSMEFGEDLAPISYMMFDNRLNLTSDTALLAWMLEAWDGGATMDKSKAFSTSCQKAGIPRPVAYLDWQGFNQALQPYLLYAADRSSGFTPQDVEYKVFPILDAVKIDAVVVGVEHKGDVLKFTARIVD